MYLCTGVPSEDLDHLGQPRIQSYYITDSDKAHFLEQKLLIFFVSLHENICCGIH